MNPPVRITLPRLDPFSNQKTRDSSKRVITSTCLQGYRSHILALPIKHLHRPARFLPWTSRVLITGIHQDFASHGAHSRPCFVRLRHLVFGVTTCTNGETPSTAMCSRLSLKLQYFHGQVAHLIMPVFRPRQMGNATPETMCLPIALTYCDMTLLSRAVYRFC